MNEITKSKSNMCFKDNSQRDESEKNIQAIFSTINTKHDQAAQIDDCIEERSGERSVSKRTSISLSIHRGHSRGPHEQMVGSYSPELLLGS